MDCGRIRHIGLGGGRSLADDCNVSSSNCVGAVSGFNTTLPPFTFKTRCPLRNRESALRAVAASFNWRIILYRYNAQPRKGRDPFCPSFRFPSFPVLLCHISYTGINYWRRINASPEFRLGDANAVHPRIFTVSTSPTHVISSGAGRWLSIASSKYSEATASVPDASNKLDG